jgi:hypothetical protein
VVHYGPLKWLAENAADFGVLIVIDAHGVKGIGGVDDNE